MASQVCLLAPAKQRWTCNDAAAVCRDLRLLLRDLNLVNQVALVANQHHANTSGAARVQFRFFQPVFGVFKRCLGTQNSAFQSAKRRGTAAAPRWSGRTRLRLHRRHDNRLQTNRTHF